MMKIRLHHSARSTPGFSLIELVTVVIIIGILAAIALPHFANNLLSFRADAAARRIATDIATAQSRANFASQAIDITFIPGKPRYQIQAMTNPDHPQAPYWVDLSTENYQANIVSADFAGEPLLQISAFGDVSPGGSIVVAVGSESRTITVDTGSGRTVVR